MDISGAELTPEEPVLPALRAQKAPPDLPGLPGLPEPPDPLVLLDLPGVRELLVLPVQLVLPLPWQSAL